MIAENFSAIYTGRTAGIVALTEIGTVVRFIAGDGETTTIMDRGGPLIDGKYLSLSFGNTLASISTPMGKN
ncbi:MAG: hypothetical protein Q8S00_23285 [Deltaproteobacteria bacterium]|nr:hypothetical protein [Deltaproteobacteria bacterium]MDZ4345165.1 hypothetical protein [Candidatus Binatia bacterium]